MSAPPQQHAAADFLALSPPRQTLLLRNGCQVGHEQVAALVEHAWSLRHSNTREAARYAELAADAAERCRDAPAAELHDLRREARAVLGNALRLVGRWPEARAAYARAFAELPRGLNRPADRARLLELRASLYRDQRRFSLAHRDLRRAAGIHALLGDRQALARNLILQGIATGYDGDPDAACGILLRAIRMVDPGTSPDLALSALQSFLWHLVQAGRAPLALRLFLLAAERFAAAEGSILRAKIAWLHGIILTEIGQAESAEDLLLGVRAVFEGEGNAFAVAAVGCDLALARVLDGHLDAAREAVRESLALFAALGVQRDALAAVLLERALARIEVSAVLLRRARLELQATSALRQ